MSKLVKKIGAIILVLCMVLSLCACEGESSTTILSLTVEDLSKETFVTNKKSDDFKVEVNSRMECKK